MHSVTTKHTDTI